MGEWRVVWEVIVLAIRRRVRSMRQNAHGLDMLTMVEGISRSEGGIGRCC